MIRCNLQISTKEPLARGFRASTGGLDGDKHHIQAGQRLGIVAPEHPSLVTVILVKQPEAHRRPIAAASPYLKGRIPLKSGLLFQVEAIKHPRAVLGVEDSAKWFSGLAGLRRIEDIGDIQISCPDQIPNIP